MISARSIAVLGRQFTIEQYDQARGASLGIRRFVQYGTRTLIVNEEDVMTTATDSKDLISDLGDLIELDYDAIAAYKAAIERLDDAAYKTKLTEFLGDHERHVSELGDAVRKEGGTPPTEGDAMKIMTKGKVLIANLLGDEAILKAMRANEEVTNTKYEEAVEHGYPEPIEALVRKGLADERRHKDWLVTTLESL